jgi:hypothetical protein
MANAAATSPGRPAQDVDAASNRHSPAILTVPPASGKTVAMPKSRKTPYRGYPLTIEEIAEIKACRADFPQRHLAAHYLVPISEIHGAQRR